MAAGFPRYPGGPVMGHNVPRPRAPPRLIRPPSPLEMERPQPMVPDVSLIIDSNATSFVSNLGSMLDDYSYDPRYNLSVRHVPGNTQSSEDTPSLNQNMIKYYPTPSFAENKDSVRSLSRNDSGHGASDNSRSDETTTSMQMPLDNVASSNSTSNRPVGLSIPGYEALKSDVATILQTVNSQSDAISQINSQLQRIIAFQEQIAVKMSTKPLSVSQAVQTEKIVQAPPQPVSPPIPQQAILKTPNEDVLKKVQPERSSGTLPIKRHSEKVSPQTIPRKPSPCSSGGSSDGKSRKDALARDERKTAEDFSAVLRNLQISNDPGPSMYSDTSMRSIDCPPFNEDVFNNDSSIGPSASAQGSDIEDDPGETVVPTNTYYNNLISTVNRILDTSQPKNVPSERPVTPRVISEQNSKNRPSSRASSNNTASYSSGLSSGSSGDKENCPDAEYLVNRMLEQQRSAPEKPSESTVESTKKYLQSIGVKFDNNSQAPPPAPAFAQNQNYMIQQNVYNSIYIPTVNCVPVISESMDSNSSLMEDLARKYIPQAERQQYEAIVGRRNDPRPGAETTMYGMSPGNLSFATKEYLKRYGLVGGDNPLPIAGQQGYSNPPVNQLQTPHEMFKSDKILDITAIRNQPKLL